MVVLVHRPAFYNELRVRKKDLGTKETMTEKNVSFGMLVFCNKRIDLACLVT